MVAACMVSLLLCFIAFVIRLSAEALWVTGYWQPVFSTAMARSPSSSPTDVTDDPAKDAFFDKLHQVVQNAPPHNITVILTEANATVSCSYRSDETKSAIGISFVESCTNDNLRRLLNLCGLNDLSIADTWFTRKKIHQWIWYTQTEELARPWAISTRRWRSFVTNARVYRGAQLAGLSMGMPFLWKSRRKRPMGWDRHKLLWDGNGTDKYFPWTSLGLSMGMSFLWESHGKRPMGWDRHKLLWGWEWDREICPLDNPGSWAIRTTVC